MRAICVAFSSVLAMAGQAGAVDLVNRDDIPRKVFVCGDDCVSVPTGRFIDLAPGEVKSGICSKNCLFVVTPGNYLSYMALKAEENAGHIFSGDVLVAIKNGKIEREK